MMAPPSSEGEYSSRRLCHMALVQKFLAAIRRDDEEGQGLAEYALILALIAIIAIVALIFLGGQVSTILSKVGASI
jgi:pilus assembly protein Flp/PilA